MTIADYAHWNEQAAMVWWQEEGRHYDASPSLSEYDDNEDWLDEDPGESLPLSHDPENRMED